MDFVLNRLPEATSNIWVDASTTWGIGGCCGPLYFMIPWNKLNQITTKTIAQKELLATIAAIYTFNDRIHGSITKLFTDNTNVFNYLRSSKSISLGLLAVWELGKYIAECKITPIWVPSVVNGTADAL